jgi:hypothetical protein
MRRDRDGGFCTLVKEDEVVALYWGKPNTDVASRKVGRGKRLTQSKKSRIYHAWDQNHSADKTSRRVLTILPEGSPVTSVRSPVSSHAEMAKR